MWNRYSMEKNACPHTPQLHLHDWMVKGEPDSFIGVLCTSWVFYRDMNKRDDDGNISYRPLFFARVSSENHEPFIMQMTAEWSKAAKAHMASPSLGRSVHHVKGDQVHPTLNSQVHPKGSTPNDWKFEVLINKNGCYPKTGNCFRRMASLCERIPCA